jgi:hypothetical protein
VVELHSLETNYVSMGSKKKERSVGRPQLFGSFMILCLILIQKTRRYGQNARRVAINIRLEVHQELEIQESTFKLARGQTLKMLGKCS